MRRVALLAAVVQTFLGVRRHHCEASQDARHVWPASIGLRVRLCHNLGDNRGEVEAPCSGYFSFIAVKRWVEYEDKEGYAARALVWQLCGPDDPHGNKKGNNRRLNKGVKPDACDSKRCFTISPLPVRLAFAGWGLSLLARPERKERQQQETRHASQSSWSVLALPLSP